MFLLLKRDRPLCELVIGAAGAGEAAQKQCWSRSVWFAKGAVAVAGGTCRATQSGWSGCCCTLSAVGL